MKAIIMGIFIVLMPFMSRSTADISVLKGTLYKSENENEAP